MKALPSSSTATEASEHRPECEDSDGEQDDRGDDRHGRVDRSVDQKDRDDWEGAADDDHDQRDQEATRSAEAETHDHLEHERTSEVGSERKTGALCE